MVVQCEWEVGGIKPVMFRFATRGGKVYIGWRLDEPVIFRLGIFVGSVCAMVHIDGYTDLTGYI